MGNTPKPFNPTLGPRGGVALWRAALTDPLRIGTLDANPVAPKPGQPVRFDPPAEAASVADGRARLLGPTWAALSHSFGGDAPASGDDFLRAEAALGVVPALLLASAAKPVTDEVYRVIDRIPEAVRRPFHKLFGILVDSGVAAATGALQTMLDASVRGYDPSGPPPRAVDLPVDSLSQLDTSCGETAVAMILKAAGEPVLLGETDTQVSLPSWAPGTGGANLLVDREFARRGLSAVSGVGDLPRLKRFLASGMPVMVSLGWSNGGGHFAVASGYDDARGTVRVRNWAADGKTADVPVKDFEDAWARHFNLMTAVAPRRDPRLEKLLAQGELRQPTKVSRGFSVTDFWCDPKRVFVEAAYRYVTPSTDVTVRVSFNSEGLSWGAADEMRWLNGAVAVRQRVASGWHLGVRVEKLSLRKEAGEWTTWRATPVGAAVTLDGPGFNLAVAGERGGVQASLAVSLGKALADAGLKVNVSVTDQGQYSVMGVLAGTF